MKEVKPTIAPIARFECRIALKLSFSLLICSPDVLFFVLLYYACSFSMKVQV